MPIACAATPIRALKAADGRSMFVKAAEVADSRHAKVACSQCHSEVNVSKVRPCEAITNPVDCTKCHEAVGQQYQRSTHGQLFAKHDANAPVCKECHGTHHVLGKQDPVVTDLPHQRARPVRQVPPRRRARRQCATPGSSTRSLPTTGRVFTARGCCKAA